MASSTSPSSLVTSQTASIAQTNVSTNASTLVSVFTEESLEIFAFDQIHDFYYNGYSQDEADMVSLFLGASAVVYLIGYIASILILRHRRNKRKAWRDAMTEYYRSGGIPTWQADGFPTYINGTPRPLDTDDNPYYCAPYMTQLHRIQLPLPSGGEVPVVDRPQATARPNSPSSEVPTAITSPAGRLVEIAQPPVLPSAETLV